MKYFLFTCTFILLSFSCKKGELSETENELSSTIEYAKGFDILKKDGITTLVIYTAYKGANESFRYQIVSKKTENGCKQPPCISVPVTNVILTSTTHIPMVELLQEEQSIVGFPHTQYVSSERTRKKIANGSIREIGKEGALNTEIVMDLQPDLVVGYSVSGIDPSLNTIQKSGINVIYNGDWLEESPLGRAEWIKFFGVLYDKEVEANRIFTRIKKDYLSAKELAKSNTAKPSVLSGAIMGNDIWNLPAGDSFVAQFLQDANLNYLWKDSKGKGSLSLSFESVYEKGKEADYWIAPGYFNSKSQMLNANELYAEFNAFQNNKIYTPSTKKGPSGGVLYYEIGPSRPDLVLKDLIKITRSNILKEYKLTFFEKMK